LCVLIATRHPPRCSALLSVTTGRGGCCTNRHSSCSSALQQQEEEEEEEEEEDQQLKISSWNSQKVHSTQNLF